jgi:hypothetical protein
MTKKHATPQGEENEVDAHTPNGEKPGEHPHGGNGPVERAEAPPAAKPAEEADNSDMRRAEEMVDRMAERVGHYASVVGFKLMQWAARAREEAEDIWAEAQSIRRGDRS